MQIKSKYQLYIDSQEWKEKARARRELDGNKCVVCGRTIHLNVHHLTYETVYNESLDDLITLCDECHATYHTIQRMADLRDEVYRQKRAEESQKAWEEQAQQRKENLKKRDQIVFEAIVAEYKERDLSHNGDLDMCNWALIKSVLKSTNERFGYEYSIGSSDIYNYFLNERCELLLRCIEKGIPLHRVQTETKLDPNWVYKWYNADRLKAKINTYKHIER